MHELANILGGIVADCSTDAFDIQASTSQVSSYKHLELAIPEVLDDALPALLGLASVIVLAAPVKSIFYEGNYFLAFNPGVYEHNNGGRKCS